MAARICYPHVPMDYLTIERYQVRIYLGAIIFGLCLGVMTPGAAPMFDTLLWPVLALLLFAPFVQVPLLVAAMTR